MAPILDELSVRCDDQKLDVMLYPEKASISRPELASYSSSLCNRRLGKVVNVYKEDELILIFMYKK